MRNTALLQCFTPSDRVYAKNAQDIDALRNNIRTEIRRILHEMLDRVITNVNAQAVIQRQGVSRAHYKLLSCARKMVVYEETPYNKQNVHVCKAGL